MSIFTAIVRGLKRQTCACGHPRYAHRHYRSGTDCAFCDGCEEWRPERRVRHKHGFLAEMGEFLDGLGPVSRTGIPEWPYARRVPESGDVKWERLTRAVNGDPPPLACDPEPHSKEACE